MSDARCRGSFSRSSLAAAAMIADRRTSARASGGTSSNVSNASIRFASGSTHSGGFSQRSHCSFNAFAASAIC